MFEKLMARVLVSITPEPVALRMVPPLTVKPAVLPVLLRTRPFTGSGFASALPDEIVENVKPPAPIVVLVRLSAVPERVLMELVPTVVTDVPPSSRMMPALFDP